MRGYGPKSSATVFLLDTSRSMFLSELFASAKNAALALGELIQSQYPDDVILFVGFAYLARLIPFSDLSTLESDESMYGTNIQHAIYLARALLTSYPVRDKQIIIVTDGEPTAHLEGDEVFFDYPTTKRCVEATLAEVESAVRERLVVATFLLNAPPSPTGFVRQLHSITEGHLFPIEPDNLKDTILTYYQDPKRMRDDAGRAQHAPWDIS